MAAERPNLDAASPSTSRIATSGTSTPFCARTDLPVTPSSNGTQMENVIGRTGGPMNRSRPGCSDSSQPRDAFEQDNLAEEAEPVFWQDERGRKRRRLGDNQVDHEPPSQQEWLQQDIWEGWDTLWNGVEFLAQVDRKLQQFEARQPAR
ncbi:Fc.00g073330.m01.CDS01 [Cosmosporella sp. VM-42]